MSVIHVVAAGLTHGAFNAHFGSKEELEMAAVGHGQSISLGRVKRSYGAKKGEGLYADRYLSRLHRDNPGDGCTMDALAQEAARSTPELKAAFEQGVEEIRKEAIFQPAAMVGGVVLARAVQDARLSEEILESVRREIS